LQRAEVVKQLRHFARACQRVAMAYHCALAIAAHGVRRLRAAKLYRRATAWAGRAVASLKGFSGQGAKSNV
jgi:hypothetical protein